MLFGVESKTMCPCVCLLVSVAKKTEIRGTAEGCN